MTIVNRAPYPFLYPPVAVKALPHDGLSLDLLPSSGANGANGRSKSAMKSRIKQMPTLRQLKKMPKVRGCAS